MKPRITLAESILPDGQSLVFQEHDGRKSLIVHGQEICGNSTKAAEEELARLACAPFRPARQPKILFCGLGLGQALAVASKELLQKRAQFIVAEPIKDIIDWHREFLPENVSMQDDRVSFTSQFKPEALKEFEGSLHAIIIHMDAAAYGPKNRPWIDDRRWLTACYDSLQDGGLLAIAGSRYNLTITRNLQRAGFEVIEYTVPSSPQAKKPRLLPIWLARKGRPQN